MNSTTENKVDILEYLTFRQEYFQGSQGLRFGQAFLNRFFPDVRDSHLFYEMDIDRAENYVLEYYVGVEKADVQILS